MLRYRDIARLMYRSLHAKQSPALHPIPPKLSLHADVERP